MSVTANPGTGGAVFGTRTIAGIDYSYTIPGVVVAGVFTEVTAAAPMPITGAVTSIVNPADVTASLPTLNAALTTSALLVTPNGYRGGAFDIGALAGGAVVVFEQLATQASTVWDALNLIPLGGGPYITSTAAAGRFEFIAGGAYQMRARIGTVGTGTVAVSVELTNGQKLMRIFNTSRANLSVNASLQIAGVDNSVANPAFVSIPAVVQDPRLSDGAGNALTVLYASINAVAAGANIIVTGVATKKIKVLGYFLLNAAGTTNTVTWQDNSATPVTFTGGMPFIANQGLSEATTPYGLFSTTVAGNALMLNLSAATAMVGHIAYVTY